VVFLAAAVGALAALSGAEAADKQPQCGDTITADTRLDRDLVDCPNNGIVIGVDDITLDLNGHTVSGDGSPAVGCNPRKEFCDVGVLNFRNDGFRLKDGAVRDFAFGPWIARAHDSRVIDVSSKQNTTFGFVVSQSSQILIRDSSGNDNIPPEGDGMGLFSSHNVQILDSSFRHNPGPGIHVGESNNNLIKGNRFSDSSPGVLIEGDHNRLRGNRFVRNAGGGILVGSGSRNVLARNHFSRDREGIAIEKGRHNLVERNVVVDARSRGIRLGVDLPDESIGAVDTTLRRNEVRGTAGDAFLINHKGTSVLRRNIASGARGSGFHVESRSTKLTKNRATHNADLGIDAVRGVINGGGNFARHNGDRRQCVHIACR
jgi:large repetitive protein